MKDILKNKYLVIVLILLLILLIVGFISLKNIFYDTNSDVYGSRLEDIENYNISEAITNLTIDELEKNDKVKSVSIRIQGKIIYINIDFDNDVALNTAKEIAATSLTNFTDEHKKYYDFQLFLTQTINKESELFPVIGSKHKNKTAITWINS